MATVHGPNAAPSGHQPTPGEIGWYFVEQYYTTMSRHPDRLFLFYNKNSQFVSGSETEKVNVCIGQKSIDDRIKELDIVDCKVRVTNVDTQSSDKNIVVQVIGEISYKGLPQRKFTQTFVLAQQVNGYYVLNDIFRYIVEEEEELEGEEPQRAQNEAASGYQEPTATAAPEAEPHTLTNSQDVNAREHDAQIVDQGIEQAMNQEDKTDEATPAHVNGDIAEHDSSLPQPDEPSAAAPTSSDAEAAPTDESAVQETIEQPEKPLAPEPTPAVSPPKPASTQPASTAPPKPAAPKTWANLVAGGHNKVAVPAAPQASIQAPAPGPTQPKAIPSVQTQNAANFAANSAVSIEAEQPSTPQSTGSDWQTARNDHNKKQPRPQGMPAAPENSRAYIKNIGENIDQAMLKDVLTKFGEIPYLDINRQKNCAFAEFATPAAYQAAVAANPHEVNGERIYVEERRVRPQGFGGYGPRGGAVGRGGRGSIDGGRPAGQGRGGFQQKDGGRGGFPNRGRGSVNGRGRGVQQAV